MPDLTPFSERSADHLRLVLEAVNIGIWELDVSSGRAKRNLRHDEIFGYKEPLSEWTYDRFLSHVVEPDRQRIDELQRRALEKGEAWEFECKIEAANGEERWISATGRPLKNSDGKVEKLIGHVIDITHTRTREARLELITEELNHRVRNMLGVIGSMIEMSASKASDIPSFAKALRGRVDALARSHQLLAADGSLSITPSNILEREFAAFPILRKRTRIDASGEPLLSWRTGQGLALIFHELITNAIKYGAFSNESGRIEVQICGNDRSVRIFWQEQGGPPVANTREAGFGSRLISSILSSNGNVRIDYLQGGIECEILVEKPSDYAPLDEG